MNILRALLLDKLPQVDKLHKNWSPWSPSRVNYWDCLVSSADMQIIRALILGRVESTALLNA